MNRQAQGGRGAVDFRSIPLKRDARQSGGKDALENRERNLRRLGVILRLILSFGRRRWTTRCPARDWRSDHRSVAVDCQ
jgi:hypothetical protein